MKKTRYIFISVFLPLFALFFCKISYAKAAGYPDAADDAGLAESPAFVKAAGIYPVLPYLSVNKDKIVNEEGYEIYLRGMNYNCFYPLNKVNYDKLVANGIDPDKTNIDLSRYFFSSKDILTYKELNANVVRIEIRLWQLEKSPYVYNETNLKHLDNIIKKWGDAGIYVILDLHACGQNWFKHNKEYGEILWYSPPLQDRVVALWGMLSKRYQGYSCVAGYDVINEPTAPTKEILNGVYQRLIDEIRKNDEKHIIFLETNVCDRYQIGFAGEYADQNLVLSLHYYKPHPFTFQGTEGVPLGYRYPGYYDGYYFDKKTIELFFQQILEDNNNQRPFYIGEFSASSWRAGKDAALWIRDVIDVLNKNNMHYTFQQYKSQIKDTGAFWTPSAAIEGKNQLLNRKLCTPGSGNLSYLKTLALSTENYREMPYIRQILLQGFSY